jgi:hypothetical protein
MRNIFKDVLNSENNESGKQEEDKQDDGPKDKPE